MLIILVEFMQILVVDFIHDVVKLQSKTSQHNYLVGTQGGSVELYHNNNKKLETASGGVTT